MSSSITVLPAIPLRERVSVVVLVLLVHAGLVFVWMMQPAQPKLAVNEMSVSVAMQQAAVIQPQAEPPLPKVQAKTVRTDTPVIRRVVNEAADDVAQPVVSAPPAPAVTTPATVAAAPVVDSEPDYKASYLNNPRPAYPMVARRMGWQGRVILNVEVLSEGACGAVNVLHSSGHEVLDNAAMNTVKSWRFVPASHAGRVVTQWFKVPIVFSLEDNAV
ncbi:MAG: TonB family protein [Gallionella sp.]|jgi:protein TonB